MKTPVSVTIDDLEVTAKDNKRGIAEYGLIKVYWDDATNKFNYYHNSHRYTRNEIQFWLAEKHK